MRSVELDGSHIFEDHGHLAELAEELRLGRGEADREALEYMAIHVHEPALERGVRVVVANERDERGVPTLCVVMEDGGHEFRRDMDEIRAQRCRRSVTTLIRFNEDDDVTVIERGYEE